MKPRVTILWSVMLVCSAALVGCGDNASTPSGSSAPPSSSKKAETKPAKSAESTSSSVAAASKTVTVAEGWGTLKGKFVFDGTAPSPAKLDVNKDLEVCGKHNLIDESLLVDKDGGLANVVVYVRSKVANVHPDAAKAAVAKPVYDNHGCRFEPHVLGVLVGQTIVLKNSDAVGHNSNVQPIGDEGANPLLPPMGESEYKFNRVQQIPVTVSCNIHQWMKGYVLPRDNPYIAVSKPDGTFEIKNLPAGELEFQAWHEKSGYVAIDGWDKGRFKQTIQPGDNDLGTKKLPAALFNK